MAPEASPSFEGARAEAPSARGVSIFLLVVGADTIVEERHIHRDLP
jgi:hypothetical protein